jgi:hypothetical protein
MHPSTLVVKRFLQYETQHFDATTAVLNWGVGDLSDVHVAG